ncbi:MAG: carbon-nitrogen family hydrolase [Pseudomonadota bacterium]
MKKFKAGVVQFDVQKGQVQANLDTILPYLKTLASEDVRLAILPEMFSSSFDNENLIQHAKKTPDIIGQLCVFAKQNHMAIAGSLPEQENGQVFNTMIFIDTDGMIKAKYKKLHLFRLTNEHHFYTAGDRIKIIDTSLGRAGLMICYDLRFPELSRSLFLQGAQMILVSAQWPSPRENHWQALVKARAIENQLFVLGANRTGTDDSLAFPGMSTIVDPQGVVLSELGEKQGIGVADIDMELLETTRASIPCMTDRRSDIYG